MYMQSPFPLIDDDKNFEKAKEVITATYTKEFSVGHANQIFMDLSSKRKEKIVRALYLGDLAIRRMWEAEGSLHYEVLSSRYFKELEYTKLYDIEPVRTYTQVYIVIYNPWTLKYSCNCEHFGVFTDIDYCTHIIEVKLMNILKDYIPYFLYAYRFLLPQRCYKDFMSEFGHL